MSISQIWIYAGPYENVNTVEAGWIAGYDSQPCYEIFHILELVMDTNQQAATTLDAQDSSKRANTMLLVLYYHQYPPSTGSSLK
ncbi:hypothetical protein CDL15_Pgr005424 [Punica granatum]|uniref:Neprosin domain-containing protein n=1 Tax=Punica granatum TaxID=22663 RepID=A0A218WVT2_PUNGR|nr:hypothetical protein CDL15_Pgr005424 [Punica granatum]